MTHQNLLGETPPTLLPDEAGPREALAAGTPAARGRRRPPDVLRGLGHPGRGGAGRRPDRRGLRLRPHRLPPGAGRAAPQRLEGPRPGAVGARAQPRVPACPARAGPGGGGDPRGRRGGPLRAVPGRQQPDGRPRAGLTGRRLSLAAGPRATRSRRRTAEPQTTTRRGTVPCRGSAPRRGSLCPAEPAKRCRFGATDSNLPLAYAPPGELTRGLGPGRRRRDDLPGDAAQPRSRPRPAGPPPRPAARDGRRRGRRPAPGRPGHPGRRRAGAWPRRRPRWPPSCTSSCPSSRSAGPAWTRSGPACPASRPTTWSGQSRAWSSMPFELLSMDESFAAVEDIQRGTTGEVLSCHPAVNIEVDAPTYVDLLTHQLAEGRPMRGLYPTDVLGRPGPAGLRAPVVRRRRGRAADERRRCRPSRCSGPRSRWCPRPGAAGPTGTLLVRAPALVALVRELFDAVLDPRHPAARPAPRSWARPRTTTTSAPCSTCSSSASRTRASPGTSASRCAPSGGGSRR